MNNRHIDSTSPCDWCDTPATHRRISAQSTVASCREHYALFLGVLQRRRVLASRVTRR